MVVFQPFFLFKFLLFLSPILLDSIQQPAPTQILDHLQVLDATAQVRKTSELSQLLEKRLAALVFRLHKLVLADLLRLDPQISRLLGDLQSLDVEEQLCVALVVGDLSQFRRVICSAVS